MARIKNLDHRFSVGEQIAASDFAMLKAERFTSVICNRPDNESTGQPSSRELETAAKSCGLTFHYIPLGGGDVSSGYVDAMSDAMRASTGRTLAFCRSGLRSALLWALASVKNGADRDATIARVETAGYPTRVIRSSLGAGTSAAA